MELPDMVEDITIQSDISFLDSKKHEHKQQKMTPPTVARARTVFGLDTLKTKENRAIHVWKNTVSQLSEKERIESEKRQKDDDIYDILLHPALIVREKKFPFYTLNPLRFCLFIILL
jgi:hypothetical protein